MSRTDINIIPPITSPLGRSWSQPSTKDILIDDTHAVMCSRTFRELAEYSASMPSGVYDGKMWKRHDGVFDRNFIAKGGVPEWMLVWYGFSDKPGHSSIQLRKVLVIE